MLKLLEAAEATGDAAFAPIVDALRVARGLPPRGPLPSRELAAWARDVAAVALHFHANTLLDIATTANEGTWEEILEGVAVQQGFSLRENRDEVLEHVDIVRHHAGADPREARPVSSDSKKARTWEGFLGLERDRIRAGEARRRPPRRARLAAVASAGDGSPAPDEPAAQLLPREHAAEMGGAS